MEIENTTDRLDEIPEEYIGNLSKYKLIVRWAEGEAVARIAEEVGILKGTATKLIQKFKQYGDVLYDARKNNSRPKALDNKDKKVIEKSLRKNPKAS